MVVSTISANGLKSWRPKALILANGALERIIPFPGWTLPGVMGLAACTILLKSQFVLPGRSTVVAGCGPLLMSVAYAIVKAGGNVSAIVDLSSKSEWVRVFPKMLSRPDLLLQGMKWLWKLKNEGIKISKILYRRINCFNVCSSYFYVFNSEINFQNTPGKLVYC